MTTTPEPPPVPDDESGAGAGAADDRFDRRIAIGVVVALAVVGTVGPFGLHLLSNGSGGSKAAAAAVVAAGGGGGGAGSNGIAAVVPAATTSSPSPVANPAEAASAACAAALAAANSTGGGSATTSSVRAWGVTAAPSISALRTDSATLHGIVVSQDPAAVPATAKSLCDHAGTGGQLAAMPDAVGATAWRAALSAYIAAATDALAAANNHPAYWQAAQAQLAQGEQELDTLTSHITAVG